MNIHTRARHNLRQERHVLAAVGTGGTRDEVFARVSNRLTPGERNSTLARLEANGAVIRDAEGNLTYDLQAWATMRRNRT